MKVIEGLYYSKEHEWVKVDGEKAYLGITDYAQQAMGDIVYVELPETGTELAIGEALGVVESVKAASDIYTPLSGTVVDINTSLEDSPEEINNDPYESWIAAFKMSDAGELDNLMDAEDYKDFLEEE